MATISVIVPVYRVEEYLHRCVDSILNQTYRDFEVILVDDGSPDNCGIICDEYAHKDKRVKVIHQPNGGLSAARNSGIDWVLENSDSNWICFVDSDDWIHKQYLEILLKAAIMSDCLIVACDYESTSKTKQVPTKETLAQKEMTPEEYWCINRVGATVAWAKLYAKRLWINERYPYGRIHEDEYTTYKVLFAVKSVCIVFSKLYYYYFNETSIMNTEWNPKRLDSVQAFEEQIEYFKKKKYNNAENISIKYYLMNLVLHLEYMIGDTRYSNDYGKKIRRKLIFGIFRYGVKKRVSSKEAIEIYKNAFPHWFNVSEKIRYYTERVVYHITNRGLKR